jgi:hypothetical protein
MQVDEQTHGREHHHVVATRRTYSATLITGDDGKVYVPVPFDPGEVWGAKTRHTITGTVDEIPVRGQVQAVGGGRAFVLGAAWIRDRGRGAGDHVQVVIEAEGPQRGDLADDIAAALAADPKAGESFDSLAQFYRKAFLTWIDSTRRRPQERPKRIAEMVELLRAGKKQR